MQNESIIRVAIGTGLILLIPLILQLTIGTGVDGQGFNWKLSDFVTMGILLLVAGTVIDFVVRKLPRPIYKVIAVISIILLLLVVWVHLAVGIVDSWPLAGS